MSVAIPPIDQMSESERDEMLGRLVVDAFARHGFGVISVRVAETRVGFVVPKIDPAVASTVPDLPPEYVAEIKRRAATPEAGLTWPDFRERLARDLRESAAG
jgi:hypothetical protein